MKINNVALEAIAFELEVNITETVAMNQKGIKAEKAG